MEYADEQGLRLVLDVMAKDTAAMRLYEALGWQRIGVSKHTYGDGQQTDAICYVSPATLPVESQVMVDGSASGDA